jgi:hypothetical protein
MLQDNKNLTQEPSNSGFIFITLPIKLLFMQTTKGRKVPDKSHVTTYTLGRSVKFSTCIMLQKQFHVLSIDIKINAMYVRGIFASCCEI